MLHGVLKEDGALSANGFLKHDGALSDGGLLARFGALHTNGFLSSSGTLSGSGFLQVDGALVTFWVSKSIWRALLIWVSETQWRALLIGCLLCIGTFEVHGFLGGLDAISFDGFSATQWRASDSWDSFLNGHAFVCWVSPPGWRVLVSSTGCMCLVR